MNNFELHQLAWENTFFKISSCKVTLKNKINDMDLLEIEKEIKPYEFTTIRNINNEVVNNKILKKLPCYLIDVNIQFVFTEKKNAEKHKNPFIYEGILNEQDKIEIVNIIKESFIHSRFFDENRLPITRYNVYVEWFQNSIFDKNKRIILTRNSNGKITSFVIFNTNRESIVQIELICSIEKGMGTILIDELKRIMYYDEKLTKIVVGTQLNNIVAQNFYIRQGFNHHHNDSIYHLWKEDLK